MWYTGESTVYPQLIDTTSSKKWVYVRKNIKEESRTDEAGNSYTVWTFDETKISKDVYSIFESQVNDEARLADIEEVITEIIGGGLI
jgi:hypothetical protein